MKRPGKLKVVPATPRLQADWDALLARQPTASPFLAHDLPGADAEIARVLKQVSQDEADTASARFVAQRYGRLSIEVEWTVDPEVVKRNKGKKK